jgi:hypothetical protein
MALIHGRQSSSLSSALTTTGLVWHLDATNTASYPGTGNIWYDISGTGLNATGTTPITGQALSGNQPYTTASTSILNTDTHTLCLLLRVSEINGNWSKIFGYEPAGTDRSPGIWRWPTERKVHWRYDPGNNGADISVGFTDWTTGPGKPGEELDPNKWYYLCVSKNGSISTSYLNGQKLGTNFQAAVKTAGSSPIYLYPGDNQVASKMQAVHLYNRVLSDEEIRQNFRHLVLSRSL